MADRSDGTPREELLTLINGLYYEWMRDPEPEVLEPRLLHILDFLEGHPASHAELVEVLQALALVWPPAAIELLEFTMASLRWPEIEETLLEYLNVTTQLERRRPAERVLLAYEDHWANAHLYPSFEPKTLPV